VTVGCRVKVSRNLAGCIQPLRKCPTLEVSVVIDASGNIESFNPAIRGPYPGRPEYRAGIAEEMRIQPGYRCRVVEPCRGRRSGRDHGCRLKGGNNAIGCANEWRVLI